MSRSHLADVIHKIKRERVLLTGAVRDQAAIDTYFDWWADVMPVVCLK